jgi:hypothetical protein
MQTQIPKMSTKAELIFNTISATELGKFLNDPARLGMTEEQQKEHIKFIDIECEKVARDLTKDSFGNEVY